MSSSDSGASSSSSAPKSSSPIEARARQVLADGPCASDRPHRVLLSTRPNRWVVADEVLGVVVKAYRRDVGPWAWIRDRVFGRRAVRVAKACQEARRRGLPVPRVLAVVDDEKGSALALALIPSARRLSAYASSLASAVLRQRWTVEVATLLRCVHRARIYPSDFHAGNVLVDRAGDLHLVDPDGLRAVLWVSRRRRVRNIERLLRDFSGLPWLSRSARLRFLTAYAGDRREPGSNRSDKLTTALTVDEKPGRAPERRRSGDRHRSCWGRRSLRRLWWRIDVLSRKKRAQYEAREGSTR
ncbi:MAG: hypothetical protein IPK13_03285 [Deltaproteobacteria bacterium]|nr:hypothetical protein [Deltaproteobacteria bacterium]